MSISSTPYYNNLIKRAVKTPKLYFTDTGLCSHLLGITNSDAAILSPLSGALLETYVIMEICKSHWYAGTNAEFWFYRDASQHEVDLVLEMNGKIHPIEVKRAASVKARDILPNMNAFRGAVSPEVGMGAVVLVSSGFGAIDVQTALVPVGSL